MIVGTTVFGPYGKYPGLEERLDELCDLVDEMAALTAKQYPGAGWTWHPARVGGDCDERSGPRSGRAAEG